MINASACRTRSQGLQCKEIYESISTAKADGQKNKVRSGNIVKLIPKLSKVQKINGLIFLLLSISAAFAVPASNNAFPMTPRLALDGTTGTDTYGSGDGMVPLWGNPNQILFGDIQGKYGSHSAWLLSAGLGERKIIKKDTILGAYLFDDVNRTPFGSQFNVLSPGVEFMTIHWDGHLNGYFPTGEQSKLKGLFTGQQLGMNNSYFYSGHSEYENLFDSLENVGPGADLEIGRTFYALNRTRFFLGGYHFSPRNVSNVNGIEGGIEVPMHFKGASLEFRDSYDNIEHNTFLVTLRATFGGPDKTGTPNIHQRMLDRIPRHLGNLNNGDGIPSQVKAINTGSTTLIKNNLWFFNPATSTSAAGPASTHIASTNTAGDNTPITNQSCTYEHPCMGLSQADINGINAIAPNATFYIDSGTYNNMNVGNGFSFYNGQNIFGRTNNFAMAASGSNRPLLNDTVFLNGNNTFQDMSVNGNSAVNVGSVDNGNGINSNDAIAGIVIPSSATAGPININDTAVTANSTSAGTVGVLDQTNQAVLNINNSSVFASSTNRVNPTSTPGIFSANGIINNGGTINIAQSAISAQSTSDTVIGDNASPTFVDGLANGIVNNAGTMSLYQSTVSATATEAGFVSSLPADVNIAASNGIINNGGNMSISQSNISSKSIIDNFFPNNAIFISGTANGINNENGNVSLTQSNVVAEADINNAIASGLLLSDGLSASHGVLNNNGTININNSSISATTINNGLFLNGAAIGIDNQSGTVNLANSTVTANGDSGSDAVLGTINDNGGNTCFKNGVAVPCH